MSAHSSSFTFLIFSLIVLRISHVWVTSQSFVFSYTSFPVSSLTFENKRNQICGYQNKLKIRLYESLFPWKFHDQKCRKWTKTSKVIAIFITVTESCSIKNSFSGAFFPEIWFVLDIATSAEKKSSSV